MATMTYNELENLSETGFMLQFIDLFPKDMKYFLGQSYSFDEKQIELIKVYEEFLTLNKGFVESKYNTDIKLPESVKIEGAEGYKELIDKVLETKDLSKLLEYLSTII